MESIGTALLALVAVWAILGFLFGLRRGWKRSICRFVTIIAAFVIALILSGSLLANLDIEALLGELGGEADLPVDTILEITTAVPSLAPFLFGLLRPFLFMGLFMGSCFVLWFLYRLIALIFLRMPKKKKVQIKAWKKEIKELKKNKAPRKDIKAKKKEIKRMKRREKKRLLGGVIGLVQGAVVMLLVLCPIVGLVSMVGGPIAGLMEPESSENGEAPAEENELLAIIEDENVVLLSNITSPVFKWISSFKIGESTVSLTDEVDNVMAIVDKAATLGEVSFEEFGEDQTQALHDLVALLDESELFPKLISEMLSYVAGQWQAGETVFDMEKIDMGEEMAPIMDALLDVFATTDEDKITGDLTTLADLFSLIIECDIPAHIDGEDLFNQIAETNFLNRAFDLLDGSRFAGVGDAILGMGNTMLKDMIGGSREEIEANYGEAIDSVIEEFESLEGDTNEEKITILADQLKAEAGEDIPADLIDDIANFIIDEIGEEPLTKDAILDVIEDLTNDPETLKNLLESVDLSTIMPPAGAQ